MYTNKELVMPTVLITGGHAGLGFEAAKELASGAGLDLLLAGRDPNRIEIAAQKLRAQYGVDVGVLELDLSSLATVRAAATRVRAMLETGEIDSLQAILSNAGAQFQGPVSYSADGYEETFAVNYLGPFLLVNLLLDRVSDGGRIVFTASGTHDPETMDGRMVGAAVEPDAGALALEGKNGGKAISGGKRYTTSKLATVLLAYELDRTSPMKWVLKRLGVTMGSLSFSGPALARVAYDPSFADGSGKYFQSKNGSLIEARSSKTSYDEERAAKLWRDSEQLVHLQSKEDPALLR